MSGRANLAGDLAGAGDVVVDPDVLESFRADQAPSGLVGSGTPLAMVRPRDTGEVQAALAWAATTGTPVVPRGAGSGLSGGANAIDGCLLISTERMTDILAVDSASMSATVQPGVINAGLREAASKQGLFYAPDPASFEFSTLGGNIATNAGGLCCLKYGVTRDSLLAAEMVLADGRAIRLGSGTKKGVAGYDLLSLVCGSEGTLGIITEATVRLRPRRPPVATLAASFAGLEEAGRAVGEIVRATDPSILELMDRRTIAAVEGFAPQGLDEDVGALLFACSDAPVGASLAEVEAMAARCEANGATLAVVTDDVAEGRMLMNARRLAYPALESLGATLLDDVCVPLDKIRELLGGVAAIADAHELTIGTFGHAGDGNMHPTIVYDPTDGDALERARRAFDAILRLALALGGTITGEHGVGSLKLGRLDAELGEARAMHRAVKRAFDPAGILNPGKGI